MHPLPTVQLFHMMVYSSLIYPVPPDNGQTLGKCKEQCLWASSVYVLSGSGGPRYLLIKMYDVIPTEVTWDSKNNYARYTV